MKNITNTKVNRLIAFYLPQFHQIPENDEWWEEGFTEWTNVKRAKSLFDGHKQPIKPGALGYYDLTDPLVRNKQAEMASQYGIEGFCYWHYWFGNGKRILERPFNEVLESGEPNFPFCLCWANQTWTGVWHGAPDRVLIKQTYPSIEDEELHFQFLANAFSDNRYIKINGKPVFLVYDIYDLPDIAGFVKRWRGMAERYGFSGIYLIAMSHKLDDPIIDLFDAFTSHGPGDFINKNVLPDWLRFVRRILNQTGGSAYLPEFIKRWLKIPLRYDFSSVVESAFSEESSNSKFIPCVLTGWDNTPRSSWRGLVFTGYTPELLLKYFKKAVTIIQNRPKEERIILVKAWNEWAEGNALEPRDDVDDSYLNITKTASKIE